MLFAFSAAFRSSSIFELLLALAVAIALPLHPSIDQAQRPKRYHWIKNGMPYSTNTVMGPANATKAVISANVRTPLGGGS